MQSLPEHTLSAGGAQPPEVPDLAAILAKFGAYLGVRRRRAATIETYFNAIRQFWKFRREGGGGQWVVAAWRDAMAAEKKSPATIKLYVAAVKAFAKWAAQFGHMDKAAAERVQEVEVDPVEKGFKRDCLTEAQARRMLEDVGRDGLVGLRDYAMILAAVTCGLRCCELSRATIADLRSSNGVCSLFVHGKGRGAADARVKPGIKTELAIRQYLAARGEADPRAPLFASHSNRNARGAALDPKSVGRILKKYLDRVREPGQVVSAHSLRHTAATVALLKGCSLQEVQAIMRHKSVNTTLIYAHNLEFAARRGEQSVEDAIL